ncbi:MAG: L-histidine N(alpha)-methyltransferase [Acaryochloris sp. RU_4_1]|nr:L-histidine N(alpha)-methyltransferase [Acaryochloris sp. RU_4_1]
MPESVYTEPQTSAAGLNIDFNSRLQITPLRASKDFGCSQGDQGLEIIQGLSQIPKTLPVQYFYDDRGSQLFEQICELPEYYPTRTETAILQAHAPEIAQITGPCELVELGSGSSTKTRLLLDAYATTDLPQWYCPIDVSGGILEQSAIALLADYPGLQIQGYVGTYDLALASLSRPVLPARMICFLGSTLGNLNPQECQAFFAQLTKALQPGEYLLLGVDLQKSPQQLEAAYNDSQGITAAFNLNMLRHLNWRFQANFNLDEFQHLAFYNVRDRQIEMHLKSLRSQTFQLRTLDFTVALEAGETIRTEISRKFDLVELQTQLGQGNSLENASSSSTRTLHPLKVWTDPNHWFGLILCQCLA